jgi:hypothetical protein
MLHALAHLILPDFIILIILGEECKLRGFSEDHLRIKIIIGFQNNFLLPRRGYSEYSTGKVGQSVLLRAGWISK